MAACLIPAILVATSALAADAPIIVSSPWLRATPKGAPVAGGYATIANHGSTPDRLLGASLAIAPKGEVHSMTMEHGVMHMAPLPNGLSIAPGTSVTLAPGGDYHLMFEHPSARLMEGQSVPGTLIFEKAGAISVTFAVGGMAAKAAPGQSSPPP